METLDSMTLDSTINASCGYLNKRWFNQRFTPVGRWTESQSSSTSLHFVISTKFLDKKMDITEKWQQLNISTDHRNGNKRFSVSCCDYYMGFAEVWTALILNFNQVSPCPPPALLLIEASCGGICRYNGLEHQPSHSAHLPLRTSVVNY